LPVLRTKTVCESGCRGKGGKGLADGSLRITTIDATDGSLATEGTAVDVLATVKRFLLPLGLFALQRHFLLDVFQDWLGRVLLEGEGEVFGVLVDEAADGRDQDVTEGRFHEIFEWVVANRLQKPIRPYRLLVLPVFEGQTADEDDHLTAKTLRLRTLLKACLRCLEYKTHGSEEGGG
jgi:hypothetical protein